MKVYEMTIADIASEIFDKGEDFAEKIFNDIDELEKNKLLEIDQLKQQLAEKEQKFLEFQEDSIRNEQIYVRELAEKDKEIEKLKQQYTILENENGKLTTELIMDKYKKAKKEVSFGKQLAIQELEKVKELLLIESKNNPIVYNVNDDTVGGALDKDKTFETIDKQIKELKGEKDERI